MHKADAFHPVLISDQFVESREARTFSNSTLIFSNWAVFRQIGAFMEAVSSTQAGTKL